MVIEKNIIDEIVRRTNIVELIGEYITLKVTGKNYKGLCPFHTEKTPSFSVSLDGFYHCFGCGESGNAIKFLQKYLNLSFTEAVVHLGNRCGISVQAKSIENTRESEIRHIYQIAQEFYSMLLFQPAGNIAYEYFTQRHISTEMMKQFGLGYSPDKFDNLYNDLRRRGFAEELLAESKIVTIKNNKSYDFFRNRAMFPIKDFLGRTIAFGGRQLAENKLAGKYINSYETLIYDKKSTLFGLFEAKNDIRKTNEAFIVEGYLDVISLCQAGIKNVVAPCGTALTTEQLQYLKKHTNVKTIYFLFDGDAAGKNAALRGVAPALETGFDLRIITLPDGQDPDTIIKQEDGLAEFEKYKKHYLSFIDFISKKIADDGQLTTPAEKSDAIKSMLNLIWKIKDKAQHSFYINNIKEIFNYPIDTLTELYYAANSISNSNISNSNISNSNISNSNNINELQEIENKYNNRYNNINLASAETNSIAKNTKENLLPEEKIILKFAVLSTNNFSILVKNYNISENNFVTDLAKLVFETIYEYWDSSNLLQDLLQNEDVPEYIIAIVSELKIEEIGESDNWKKFIDITDTNNSNVTTNFNYKLIDLTIAKLRIKNIDEELKSLRLNFKTGDASLLNQWQKLVSEKQSILDSKLRYE